MKTLKVLSIAAVLLIVVSFGWVRLGLPLPFSVAEALIRFDLPGLAATRTVARDTTFDPGGEIDDVVHALVAQIICDQNIPCTGQQILRAGNKVRVSKEVNMQNGAINRTFAKVSIGQTEGWVDATALR
jgi:hypothetical protein